jgi:glycosyltransferase involved in cell wall biosynthesis
MSIRLSVFIPAYNEEANIEATVRELRTALHSRSLDYEIIVVMMAVPTARDRS